MRTAYISPPVAIPPNIATDSAHRRMATEQQPIARSLKMRPPITTKPNGNKPNGVKLDLASSGEDVHDKEFVRSTEGFAP